MAVAVNAPFAMLQLQLQLQLSSSAPVFLQHRSSLGIPGKLVFLLLRFGSASGLCLAIYVHLSSSDR